jgi:hypothetical protein
MDMLMDTVLALGPTGNSYMLYDIRKQAATLKAMIGMFVEQKQVEQVQVEQTQTNEPTVEKQAGVSNGSSTKKTPNQPITFSRVTNLKPKPNAARSLHFDEDADEISDKVKDKWLQSLKRTASRRFLDDGERVREREREPRALEPFTFGVKANTSVKPNTNTNATVTVTALPVYSKNMTTTSSSNRPIPMSPEAEMESLLQKRQLSHVQPREEKFARLPFYSDEDDDDDEDDIAESSINQEDTNRQNHKAQDEDEIETVVIDHDDDKAHEDTLDDDMKLQQLENAYFAASEKLIRLTGEYQMMKSDVAGDMFNSALRAKAAAMRAVVEDQQLVKNELSAKVAKEYGKNYASETKPY